MSGTHTESEALLRAYGVIQASELAEKHAASHVQAVLQYVDLQPGVKSKPALAVRLLREGFNPPAPAANKGSRSTVPPDWTECRRREEAVIDALPKKLVREAVAAIVRAIGPDPATNVHRGALKHLRECGTDTDRLLSESSWWRKSICEYGPAQKWVIDTLRSGGSK